MKNISIDIETYSDVDVSKAGVYKYSESAYFDMLLFGYAIDGGEALVVDLASGEAIPPEVIAALVDDTVIKWAFNSQFERVCLSQWLRRNYPQDFCRYSIAADTVRAYLDPSAWRCSMVWSAYMGLPLSLEGVGAVLGLEDQKLKQGKDLIRYFCRPCKSTTANGGRSRNMPGHDSEKWERFKKYNRRDVTVEMAIQQKLAKIPVPDFVWDQYQLDQEINDRGIALDMTFVKQALAIDQLARAELITQMQALTHLDNPNSVPQMKNWLADNGLETDTLGKKAVAEMLKTAPDQLAAVLSLRQQLAKSSVKKYQAMDQAVCQDGRVRGTFQFYGANRTGRWAGRLIQLQNLPQNHIPDLEPARALVRSGNADALSMLYHSVPEVLSELIRTAFVPREGMTFIVADFSAIEARVLSWLAGESWRMDVFADNGDIYCATAAKMFHCQVVKHGENAALRQKGKQCELSCGYGGSVGALKAMGALESGMAEEELQPLVNAWRLANPKIVRFWWAVDRAVKECIKQKIPTATHGIYFSYQRGFLLITLPSGRKLAYVKPRIGENRFGGESVTYEGVGSTKKWQRIESYGPKFVENIVQAISRDILAEAMTRLRTCLIVAHVHDEIIIEADMRMSVSAVCAQMARTPTWAKGLLLDAEGYACRFYKKD